jgi:pimeloyl-ACP methyl ester carboxylesterase
VLVAPAGALERTSLRSHVLPLAATAARSRPGLLALIAADALRAGPRTLWRAARDLLAEDVRSELASVRAPTLLVWGERDNDTPLWMGRRMEEAIPDAGLVVLDGGHYAYAERAAEFNRIAAHFLADA